MNHVQAVCEAALKPPLPCPCLRLNYFGDSDQMSLITERAWDKGQGLASAISCSSPAGHGDFTVLLSLKL